MTNDWKFAVLILLAAAGWYFAVVERDAKQVAIAQVALCKVKP